MLSNIGQPSWLFKPACQHSINHHVNWRAFIALQFWHADFKAFQIQRHASHIMAMSTYDITTMQSIKRTDKHTRRQPNVLYRSPHWLVLDAKSFRYGKFCYPLLALMCSALAQPICMPEFINLCTRFLLIMNFFSQMNPDFRYHTRPPLINFVDPIEQSVSSTFTWSNNKHAHG